MFVRRLLPVLVVTAVGLLPACQPPISTDRVAHSRYRESPSSSLNTAQLPAGVTLQFGWPLGHSIGVNGRWRVEQTTWDVKHPKTIRKTTRASVTFSYSIETAPLPDGNPGVAITLTDFRVGAAHGPHDQTALATEWIAAQPMLAVDARGALMAVPGAKLAAARYAAILERLGPGDSADRAREARSVNARTIEIHARMYWYMLVQVWAGQTLEPGRVRFFRGWSDLPLLDNSIVRSRFEIRINERVACDRTDSGRRCVKLTEKVVPDDSDVKRAVDRFRSNGEKVVAFHRVGTQELVVEPDTLLPHHVIARDTEVGTVAFPSGREYRSRREQRLTQDFAYLP